MAITAAELKLYGSTVVNDAATNGGRVSSNEVVDGIKHELFPALTDQERLDGITRNRKFGFKVANDDDIEGVSSHVFLEKITPGSSRIVLFKSANNARDTQGDFTGSERLLGVGVLNADVLASVTVLVVDCEADSAADLVFQAGDTIFIGDGTNYEFLTIDAGGVAWAGDTATITLTAGTRRAYAAATPTIIAACINQSSVKTSFDNWVETTALGTYDEATYPLVGDNIGTIEQTWTLTFTDATNYSVAGDTVGSVGAGTIGGDFVPNNADFVKPYFTLLAAGFGGTWANGESIVFQTHMATIDGWARQITPAGATGGTDSTIISGSVESV